MFPLMTDTPFSPAQIVAATRLMLAMARVDGAKTAEEEALIRGFYTGCAEAGDGWPSFDSLQARTDTAAATAADFPDAGQRDTVLALCLMVAFADGALSEEEDRAARAMAAALGADDAVYAGILARVKDGMLASLSGLPDAGSVAVVARELG